MAALFGEALSTRLLERWNEVGVMSINGFVRLVISEGIISDEEFEAFAERGLREYVRKSLRARNPATKLPWGAQTPRLDDDGKPIWTQPELFDYEEAVWKLERDLTSAQRDIDAMREWYDMIRKRWHRVPFEFPILIRRWNEKQLLETVGRQQRLGYEHEGEEATHATTATD